MLGENVVSLSIIAELHSWDIQGDEMASEGGVTRSILMNLIFGLTNGIKWKV